MLRSILARVAVIAILVSVLAAQDSQGAQSKVSVTLRYLGTAGWEISDGATVILIDPYLSRINGPPPPGGAGSRIAGDTRPKVGWDDIATPDIAAIDSRISRADFILVTHTHYDHVLAARHGDSHGTVWQVGSRCNSLCKRSRSLLRRRM